MEMLFINIWYDILKSVSDTQPTQKMQSYY